MNDTKKIISIWEYLNKTPGRKPGVEFIFHNFITELRNDFRNKKQFTKRAKNCPIDKILMQIVGDRKESQTKSFLDLEDHVFSCPRCRSRIFFLMGEEAEKSLFEI